jgi:transcriptional regulator with PAS, ATPase and Fis domain
MESIPQELRVEIGAQRLSEPSCGSLERMEKDAIEKTLRKCDGNRTKAAESLGISVRTLQRKIAQFGLGI